MKNKLHRIIAAACAVLMLISLASCINNPDQPEATETIASTDLNVTNATEAPTETEETIDFQGRKYNDEEFLILRYNSEEKHGWTGIPNDIFVEMSDGDILSEKVYDRNTKVEELLGVKIKMEMPASSDNMSNVLNKAIQDGDFRYSLVDQCLNEVGRLYNLGIIMDINKIGLDTSYSWFDGNSVDMFTIKGKLFAFSSDISYIDKISSVAVFFNKTMAENYQLGDLYELVETKEWTYEKMLEFCEFATADLGNQGVYDTEDSYGISCQNDGSYFFLHSAGIKTVSKNNNGDPEFTLNNEKAVTALQNIYRMMSDSTIYFNRQSTGTAIDLGIVLDMFSDNRSLFLIRPLQTLFALRDVTDDFGIIPMPLFEEAQTQYYTPINSYSATVFCLPEKINNEQMTKDVIQALSMQSSKLVMPALYETVLGSRLVHDPTASMMLDIIFENRVYDLGFIWNFGRIRSVLVTRNTSSVAGTISSTLSGLTTSIGTEINTFLTTVEKYGQD